MTPEQMKQYDEAFPDGAPAPEYPEPSMQELFDADLVALVKAVRKVVSGHPDSISALTEALDQFEPWLDNDNDPRSMGWVNDRGLP